MTNLRWTSQDLEVLPDNGKRYEIVDGELYMSRQPHLNHQAITLPPRFELSSEPDFCGCPLRDGTGVSIYTAVESAAFSA